MNNCKLALYAAFSAALAIAVASNAASAAIEYPWCAQYSGDDNGGRNCGFVSYEQCMMTARGAGAACERNSFYLDQQTKQKQQPRKRNNNN